MPSICLLKMSDEETKNDKSDEETEETTSTKTEKAEQRTARRKSSSESPPRSRSTITTTTSSRRDGPPPTKLYIGNLPDNCKRSELTELFEKFGEIEKCDVLRNFAFVVSFGDFNSVFYHLFWGVKVAKPFVPFFKKRLELVSGDQIGVLEVSQGEGKRKSLISVVNKSHFDAI